MDLNIDGTFGRCSCFNSFVPPRELNVPFMALCVDNKVWGLTQKIIPGIEAVRRISYFGHYPIADMEFDLDETMNVGLRAWSPFILSTYLETI